ncbi:MAG TPA: 4-hydroxythreonine-4-phosphate dehydrogenase PdxA [Nevskiales bacterium]|nr:4-hydroxythreonine-4-phosphate dehydrogenase PdxA [Nevskiales bacterium]
MHDPFLPRLALTPGEPAGIGPDLCVMLAQAAWPAELVAVADPGLLRERARQLKLPLEVTEFDPAQPRQAHRPGRLPVQPVPMAAPVTAGRLDPRNAPYVIATLDTALALCLNRVCDALVTGPAHKGVINEAGIAFTGHTEYLAQHTATPEPVMLLYAPGLRVALATTHLPLREVAAALSQDKLSRVLRVLAAGLRERFGLSRPRILVAGLNPHAGEGGHLGREEIEVIEPVLTRLRAAGLDLHGPLPADTLFTPPQLRGADAVLAMYHDQGLPVLKHMGFGRIVNLTLGLPILRTSVDHGTALELAGSGRADPASLRCALDAAIELCARQRAG